MYAQAWFPLSSGVFDDASRQILFGDSREACYDKHENTIRKDGIFMNETLKTLQERRSVRRYSKQQVDEAALNAILEAGTWAPSGMGTQASVLVAVQDPETIALMSRLNAQIMGQSGTDPFYGAPTVVVVLADGENPNWLKDGSLVMGNLMNAAASLGVASCWINRATELFDLPEGRELLAKWGLPATMRGVGNCILGYADGPVPAPKPRKPGRILRV